MEKYNKLSQEKEKYKGICDNLQNELNIIQVHLNQLQLNGLISKELYENLTKAYNRVCDEYNGMITLLGFDYKDFNLEVYLNEDKGISLSTGHPHPLKLSGNRRIEFMKESLNYEYLLYFPSSIGNDLFTSSIINDVFSKKWNVKKVQEIIKIFLSIVGFKVESEMIIRLDNTLETENKMFNLLEFDYQMAITQILRHLRETLQNELQITILNELITEINSKCT